MKKEVLYDDIDTDQIADETIMILTNNQLYLLDLSQENSNKFIDSMKSWLKFAKLKSQYEVYDILESRFFMGKKQLYKDIRAWALANGYPVGDRGRIESTVVEEYMKVHTHGK